LYRRYLYRLRFGLHQAVASSGKIETRQDDDWVLCWDNSLKKFMQRKLKWKHCSIVCRSYTGRYRA